MKISYNWLKELVPGLPEPEKLSRILTAVGLEVESLEKFEEIKGALKGLLVGEIVRLEKHPGADKLKITEVSTGNGNRLQIVCGADNVAVGQKVIVAPEGAEIYPSNGKPVTIKKARIRGIESQGMICAEDEIGLGNDHNGILELPGSIPAGLPAAEFFKPVGDWIYEIGLTPNRIDAMNHVGVARDICAYLSHHTAETIGIIQPPARELRTDNAGFPVEVTIETSACERYAGICMAGITVEPSPKWMQIRLKSIGVRPVNNIVDITNYVLHETGQPLHAFDLYSIKENKILVKHLPQGTPFVTLDEKKRELYGEDVMICNGLDEPMCFGGVFGGLHSAVKDSTTHVFLESAWFSPAFVRKTSLRHNLRTDAAVRFEKGVDISKTVEALRRAALLIVEITGAEIVSGMIDVYPNPRQPALITLPYNYLKKISGKVYDAAQAKRILQSLDFRIENEDAEALTVAVPVGKPDITLPADAVEEIMRIDGFDNIEIPSFITIAPALEAAHLQALIKENIAGHLTGCGFSEIFTNSLTNSKYYTEATLHHTVKIINSVSADLDIMRPSMLETGLENILYNLNRKNNDLLLFEFGNTYSISQEGAYTEKEHLCLFVSGNKNRIGWNEKPAPSDFYYIKGLCQNIFNLCRLENIEYRACEKGHFDICVAAIGSGEVIAHLGSVDKSVLKKFDIRQPVLFADISWSIIAGGYKKDMAFREIPKFPAVNRDLSVVVEKNIGYSQIEDAIKDLSIKKLKNVKLFDVFESEKLGADKKAFAVSLTFIDAEKTLTDNETEGYITGIITALKSRVGAEIRK